jgi:hypothetical protein
MEAAAFVTVGLGVLAVSVVLLGFTAAAGASATAAGVPRLDHRPLLQAVITLAPMVSVHPIAGGSVRAWRLACGRRINFLPLLAVSNRRNGVQQERQQLHLLHADAGRRNGKLCCKREGIGQAPLVSKGGNMAAGQAVAIERARQVTCFQRKTTPRRDLDLDLSTSTTIITRRTGPAKSACA